MAKNHKKHKKHKKKKENTVLGTIAGIFVLLGSLGTMAFGPLQMTPMYLIGLLAYLGVYPIIVIAIITFFSIFYFN